MLRKTIGESLKGIVTDLTIGLGSCLRKPLPMAEVEDAKPPLRRQIKTAQPNGFRLVNGRVTSVMITDEGTYYTPPTEKISADEFAVALDSDAACNKITGREELRQVREEAMVLLDEMQAIPGRNGQQQVEDGRILVQDKEGQQRWVELEIFQEQQQKIAALEAELRNMRRERMKDVPATKPGEFRSALGRDTSKDTRPERAIMVD